MNPFDISGRTYLITGASSGIGRQTAISISRIGANVIITGRNAEQLEETFKQLVGKNHKSIIADLTDEKQIDALVDNLQQLNGIVHCAGVTGRYPAQFIRHELISEMFKINYETPVLLTGKILRKKKLLNNSSIVFLSSVATKYPYYGGTLYTNSKIAIEEYSKVLALELADKSIRSNCISPYYVKTPMIEDTMEVIEDQLSKLRNLLPVSIGTPEDVANVIIFFLSDASRWVTGVNLILGGA